MLKCPISYASQTPVVLDSGYMVKYSHLPLGVPLCLTLGKLSQTEGYIWPYIPRPNTNTAYHIFSSEDQPPDFLKANYFARPKFLLGNFAQVKGHKKPKKNKGNDPKKVKMWWIMHFWVQKCKSCAIPKHFCATARLQLLETLSTAKIKEHRIN